MNKLGRTSPGQGNEVKCKEDPDCFLSLLKRAYEQVATIGTFSKLLPNDLFPLETLITLVFLIVELFRCFVLLLFPR